MSFTRAAGFPPMSTVAEPNETTPGPPGTQLAKLHGAVWLPMTAAGWPPMSTVASVLSRIGNGIAGWGTGVGTGAAG
jgi:hypothetical protein